MERNALINVFLFVCNRDDKIVSRLLVFPHVMYTSLPIHSFFAGCPFHLAFQSPPYR
jgi:hypothetical protein